MAKNYELLDAEILACLAKEKKVAGRIVSECFNTAFTTSPLKPCWGTITQRLQALRKAGKIEYVNGWWQIVEERK